MVGGGPRLSPGEVTLADHGVLFLTSCRSSTGTCWSRSASPSRTAASRSPAPAGSTTFPARFQLVAAMNPCPCGFAGSEPGRCRCGPGVPERYTGRVSGPLRDRIDLWVTMPKVAPAALIGGDEPEGSAAVAGRIAAARATPAARGSGRLNGRASGRELKRIAAMSPLAARRAIELADLEGLSGRGTERLIRVARTIADLAGAPAVLGEHLEEAARFRSPMSVLEARRGELMIGVGAARPDRHGRRPWSRRRGCRGAAHARPGNPQALRAAHRAPGVGGAHVRSTDWGRSGSERCSGRSGRAGRCSRRRFGRARPGASSRPASSTSASRSTRRRPGRSRRSPRIPGRCSVASRSRASRSSRPRTLRTRRGSSAIELPPHVLFVRGSVEAMAAGHAVAVVGTRRPTEAGRATAGRIGGVAREGRRRRRLGPRGRHRRGEPRGRDGRRRADGRGAGLGPRPALPAGPREARRARSSPTAARSSRSSCRRGRPASTRSRGGTA